MVAEVDQAVKEVHLREVGAGPHRSLEQRAWSSSGQGELTTSIRSPQCRQMAVILIVKASRSHAMSNDHDSVGR
jgi:hypothetical protein